MQVQMQIRKPKQSTNEDHRHASLYGIFLLMPILVLIIHFTGLGQTDSKTPIAAETATTVVSE